MRIAVVTDSTADIPQDLAAAYQISVVPTILVINGQSLEDGPGISRDEFYRQLPTLKDSANHSLPLRRRLHGVI